MSPAETPGVLIADPVPFIAVCWALSALVLGGFAARALLAMRSSK